jgi:hypothetical protein
MLTNFPSAFATAAQRVALGATALLVFALAPAAAIAASPTQHQYGDSLTQLAQGGGGAGTGSGGGSAAGGLPFTGLDVALLAAVAAGLTVAGLLLRRQRPVEVSKG